MGWVYGDKPTFVLTRRELPKTRPSVQFLEGDLRRLFEEKLRSSYSSIWVVGGGALCGDCLRLGLVDEVRYSFMPVLIGNGIPFFHGLDHDVPLHLKEVKAYKSGMIALCYEVKAKNRG
jgi:dihydrofolate reductase